MRMSEKCRNNNYNNNSDNTLTSRRTDGGKNGDSFFGFIFNSTVCVCHISEMATDCNAIGFD